MEERRREARIGGKIGRMEQRRERQTVIWKIEERDKKWRKN